MENGKMNIGMRKYKMYDCELEYKPEINHWIVTRPSAMGITQTPVKTFRDGLDKIFEYKQNKKDIDKQRKLFDSYCSKNPWTRSGT